MKNFTNGIDWKGSKRDIFCGTINIAAFLFGFFLASNVQMEEGFRIILLAIPVAFFYIASKISAKIADDLKL